MLDPWGSSGPTNDEDYEKIKKDFGIEEIDEVIRQKLIKNRFIRRKIIFGHRDLGLVLSAIEKKQPWAVMSGIKPSGSFHLGTSTTALEIIEFQKMGGIAVDNLADILALGLDPSPDKAYIWRQSKEPIVKDVCFKVSRLVTQNMLNAIYGEKTFGLYLSALVQTGDIIIPQIIDAPQPVIVPVGIDQDPHIRLTRDLTRRYYKTFFLPGATYHYLLAGIDGSEKMAKRNPNSYFTFNEPLESIEKKVKGALTGGRKNKKEQQELGGEPKNCMIYKMLMYHFEDDDAVLADEFERCVKGELMCGEHKAQCIEKVLKFIKQHQKKKKNKLIKLKSF